MLLQGAFLEEEFGDARFQPGGATARDRVGEPEIGHLVGIGQSLHDAGENVLDLFGGSGSTLIAAEQTGRRAFLMELDPLYCDVIVQRWENFAGQKAKLHKGTAVVSSLELP